MFGSGFSLTPEKDVPSDLQEMPAAILLELKQAELAEGHALTDRVVQLTERYRRGLHEIVGDDNLERYEAFRQELRQHVGEVVARATPTVVGEMEIKEARLQAAERSREFLREIGFDMARASELRGNYHERIQDLFAEATGRPGEPNYLVPPEMVPEDIHNPWKLFQPPYPGWSWAWAWNKSSRPWNPNLARYLGAAAGQIGAYTHIHCRHASDSDWAWAKYRTAVLFWYYLPVSGMVEMFADMQSIHTPYSGWLHDEWGWSDSVCDQESRAYLRVLVPGPGAPRKATILDYRRTGTDANWANDVTPVGAHRWAHIFSSDAYAGGTWLLLEVGTEDWNYFWTNDVSIHSAMTLRWFLKRIYVRSTGG